MNRLALTMLVALAGLAPDDLAPPRPSTDPGWRMPDPPQKGAVATAYVGSPGDGVWLYWADEDGESLGDIPWPFSPDESGSAPDLVALGFKVIH